MTRIELTAAAALLGLSAFFVLGLLIAALVRGAAARKRVAAQLTPPEIRDRLVAYLAGNNDLDRLRGLARTHRRQVAEAILAFQGAAGGGALDRLCEAALELALVHDWCEDTRSRDAATRRTAYARLAFVCYFEPCRRVAGDILLRGLDDADPDVRLFAARGVVQSGDLERIEDVFDRAVSGSLLVRVALAEDLRRHAIALAERAIPRALDSGDSARIRATLDMALAWERALPLRNLHALIESGDRGVRLQAIRLAALAAPSPEDRSAIVRALAEGDVEIGMAAARAAGRLKLAEALPGLALSVRRGPAELSNAAAAALAEIHPRGWITLEELSSSPDPAAAGAARDALARVRKAGA